MKILRRLLQLLLLLVVGLGAFLVRCHNTKDTFIQGGIYFVDADCYSRMSRVRELFERRVLIVRHQDFENYPEGIHSHATAPLDYLILAGKALLDASFANRAWGQGSMLAWQTGDLAGALVSPVLGAATCVFLALWGWWVTASFASRAPALRAACAAAPALLFAFSPILVHATLLGRPDHQSLLVFLLAVALGGEAILALRIGEGNTGSVPPASQRQAWAIVTGVAWGLALWVSLYEPPILLAAVILILLSFDRRAFLEPVRRWEAGPLLGLLLLSFLVEGGRLAALPAAVVEFFPAWSHTIGEMRPVPLTSSILPQWLSWFFYVALVLLFLARRQDRRAWPWLALVLGTLALACWQLRWGCYLALVFALSLPWQVVALRRAWVAWPLLLVAFYGPAQYWDEALFPSDAQQEAANARRRERLLLREAATHLEGQSPQPFIAAWWESPPLAYWSHQPGVAGSSHQSLPGIVDTSRFFLAKPGTASATEILKRRQVAYVVLDEAERLTGQAAALLGTSAAQDCLAYRLETKTDGAEPFLLLVHANQYFKVFAVDSAKLTP